MDEKPKRRWYQPGLNRIFAAVFFFSVALAVAASDTRKLFPEGHATWMFYFFVCKPIMIGAGCGAALGVLLRHQKIWLAIGIAIGLAVAAFMTLAVVAFMMRDVL